MKKFCTCIIQIIEKLKQIILTFSFSYNLTSVIVSEGKKFQSDKIPQSRSISNNRRLLQGLAMMMMMMNCFCSMVDLRKAFSLISSRDQCQRSSPSRISDTPLTGFEPPQNVSSGLD